MIDPSSPFYRRLSQVFTKPPQRQVFVNFCKICHYVWKAPAAASQCVNCKNENTAIPLTFYETEVPLT